VSVHPCSLKNLVMEDGKEVWRSMLWPTMWKWVLNLNGSLFWVWQASPITMVAACAATAAAYHMHDASLCPVSRYFFSRNEGLTGVVGFRVQQKWIWVQRLHCEESRRAMVSWNVSSNFMNTGRSAWLLIPALHLWELHGTSLFLNFFGAVMWCHITT
jgi:hypothetical protein